MQLAAAAHDVSSALGNNRSGLVVVGLMQETTTRVDVAPQIQSGTCTDFAHALPQAQQGDYAWALWRPYSCCESRGQVFLGSVDFN